VKIFTLLIAILLYTCLFCVDASQTPWKIWKDNSSQSVSYRPAIIEGNIDKKLIEIRATATVHSSLAGFLVFLQNNDNTQNWLVNAGESKLMRQYSVQKNSFYIKLTKIWPLQPRILILNSSYWQNHDLSVEIKVTDAINLDNYILSSIKNLDEYLQVKIYSAHWKIIPMLLEGKNRGITIEYIFIVDGRGDTPKWLADHFTLKSIWKTMRNIRRQLPKEKWQQQTVKGITELSTIPITLQTADFSA